jgi:hypothetical protein
MIGFLAGCNDSFEISDIKNNGIVAASSPGTVGPDFQVAGFGAFHATGASDMILRNKNTGEFEVYDIVNNQITTANSLGQRMCRNFCRSDFVGAL